MTHRSSDNEFIRLELQEREAKGRLRELQSADPIPGTAKVIKSGRTLLNFCSNDYLGLSTHPFLLERSIDFSRRFGTGSGASRLVSGTYSIHEELEEKLANVFKREAALLFNSGFQANTGILPAVVNRNSLILIDKKCHNSLLQGAILSRATVQRYRHNDYEHLKELLEDSNKKTYNRICIITETIFSMDGDRNDLEQLTHLKKEFNSLLYSDDAHALGVIGERGLGLNVAYPAIDLSIGTFGKSFGAFGAFAACSQQMKSLLINTSPGFIYTTALPPGVIGAIDAALELIPTLNDLREKLYTQISYLKSELIALGFDLGESNAQIIPVLVGEEKRALELSRFLETQGCWATAIRPPTVEQGKSILRLTLTAHHSRSNIDQLLSAFKQWKNR